MPQFLSLPPWEAIHPLVVHFPVALLVVTPLLILAGVLAGPARGRTWHHAALLLMLLGTVGAFVAVATGEAGEEAAERVAGTKDLLHEHEELAEVARNAFTALTLVFAAILFVPAIRRRERLGAVILPAVFLIPYLAGVLVLANTAHHGGRLVHEKGVYAHWNAGGTTPSPEAGQEDD